MSMDVGTSPRRAVSLAIPFVAANVLLAISLLVTTVNNWSRSAPRDWVVAPGSEPVS